MAISRAPRRQWLSIAVAALFIGGLATPAAWSDDEKKADAPKAIVDEKKAEEKKRRRTEGRGEEGRRTEGRGEEGRRLPKAEEKKADADAPKLDADKAIAENPEGGGQGRSRRQGPG